MKAAPEAPEGVRGGFRAAWRKGYQARLEGEPSSSNPYPDHRNYQNKVTFARAWRKTWRDGWEAAAGEVG